MRAGPSQRRSRERREAILAAAARLIAAQGTDGLKMSALAEAAGISMGSLYQYFAVRGAVIQALAAQFNAESRICVESAISAAQNPDELLRAFSDLVDDYLRIVRSDAAMRHIWAGMQTDPDLIEQQLDESRAVAEFLAARVLSLGSAPEAPHPTLECLAIWELGEAAVRLALAVDEAEGATIVSTYKSMALAELRKLLDA